MRRHLPLLALGSATMTGVSIAQTGISRAGTVVSLTLVGHSIVVGNYLYCTLTGGGSAPGLYLVTNVVGNVVSVETGLAATPTGATANYRVAFAGSLSPVAGAASASSSASFRMLSGAHGTSGIHAVGSPDITFAANGATEFVVGGINASAGVVAKALFFKMVTS